MHATSAGRSWNYCLQTTLYALRSTMYDLQSTVYSLQGSRYEYCLPSAVCRQLFTACCLRLLNCDEERVEMKRYTGCAVDVAVCRLPKNGRHVCVERTKTGPHWGMGGGNWGFGAGGMGAEAGMVLHTASGGDICNWVGSKAKFSTWVSSARGRLECSNKQSCRNSWGLWKLILYMICTCVGITTDYANLNLEINK